MTTISRSPASSGPAGSYFEGQIGAYYLLSMLASTEPRGLPGTLIDRVELQRAAEGHPLDDVIVHGHDARGNPAVLEIQVKRSITFTPSDPIFHAVVDQIAEASRRPEFWTSRYELAIATARTSRKIDGPYQDVLTWARQLGDATTFMARIDRPGSANPDMRTFVQTLKTNLHEAGSPDDNETVWRLLRKLQILIFDFTVQGSACEELAKERAARTLHPDDTVQAVNLWTTFVELALQIAASGGDRTRGRLIEDLRQRSFRLSGDRRYTSARVALAEASSQSLADIGDKVADVMLARLELVTAVHAALDSGRYVEIRGDAGVGKSGVLKHFAEQIARETSIIVLSPGRTTPKGWTAMRAVLGFDGTAHDLLTDLASDGGAVLFLDNLDFFDDEEQRTVIDLVRETVNVPGCAVISTARHNFGIEEQNWLPSDILDRLGRAELIVIGELSEAEVGELRHGSPRLAPILAENHPARDVTRNLYRLARLAGLPREGPIPRTEVDMAELWWRTADGKIDSTYRERTRLFRALAEQALSHAGPLDVSNRPTEAVDALLASETLRDLGSDRVSFSHDVLREWAIANLLYAEPTMIGRLPIDRPAPIALARGVELTARIHLERSNDGTSWQTFLERLSGTAHGSWRRAVLLALVRSEIGPELLTRASGHLLANSGSMLRELIRLVMAVDVEPASKLFASAGIDPAMIPAGIHIPNSPSWYRLIRWLLSLEKDLPVPAIPDAVNLYTAWSVGTMGLDPLTPLLIQWFHYWLTEIETARETELAHDKPSLFGGKLDEDRFRALESDLRIGFLSFCNRKPALAVAYLRSFSRYQYNEDAVRSILKFHGSLAQAAPAELADLTATALILKSKPERHNRDELRQPFDYVDHQFFPASPAQGPFLELLTHAPHHGLSLINRLIDHAILFKTHGRVYGTDAIMIAFPDGERSFPWKRSYGWSREWGDYNCITSGLMALEAWAHRRIETGEIFDNVLADVLGPHGSPAAYLLVAVDLILSHWPKSREAAIPYLACPELLCIDRERLVNDNLEYPDFFGLKALQKEPVGTVRLDSLRKRVSRQVSLDVLLSKYVFGPSELREKLVVLLHQAAISLGPPNTQSNLGDANFMVVHALNLVDPNNWHEISVTLTNGTLAKVHEYVSPERERLHLATLQDAARDRNEEWNMETALAGALDKPSDSSTEFVARAVEWAQNVTAIPMNVDKDEKWMHKEAVVTAAMVAMRDGDPELRERHRGWAYDVFAQAVKTEKDPVHRFRPGLHFNPIAIAFAGMIHGLKDRSTIKDMRVLLEVAANDNPAAAQGFCVAAVSLNSVDERLPRSVIRCAFAASIRSRRQWDQTEEEAAAQTEHNRERIEEIVDAELAWLADDHPEPDWPDFPSETNRRRRRGLRLPDGGGQPDTRATRRSQFEEYADHQAAALWLRNAVPLIGVGQRPWILELIRAYSAWTFAANGAGLETHEEIDRPPSEWNDVYFDMLARCLPGLTMSQVEQLALVPINSLPDEPFFDVVTQFVRSVDEIYFEDRGLQEPMAIDIRSALANRLTVSRSWKRLCSNRSSSIEMHIAPAIAALFFNDYVFAQPAKCYLYPKGIDRLDSFLPVLEKLVIQSGGSLFVSIFTLNLLEVSPKPAHLPFMVTSAKTWLESNADSSTFWVDNDIGRRVCTWIEGVWRQESALLNMDKAIRTDVDRLLAALVSLGVADARPLEEMLAKR